MKIWCLRKELKHERTKGVCAALARSFSDYDFHVYYMRDLPALKGKAPDIAMVWGSEMSAAARDIIACSRLRVYIPGFWRGKLRRELEQLYARNYHLVIADEVYWLDEFRRVTGHVHHVPRGFNPEVFKPNSQAVKKWYVAFVGNPVTFGRQRRLAKLAAEFPKGKVFVRSGLNHAQYAHVMQQSMIGWNQIWDTKIDAGLNYRVWEVLGAGALLFTNPTRHMKRLMKENVHAVYWYHDRDMIEKAKYYVEHDKEREEIARRGHEEALRKHTWDHRAETYKLLIRRHFR